jgi:hypothetical protein
MSALVWPLAVVLFNLLLFSLTLFLVRRFAHEHDDDEQAAVDATPQPTLDATPQATA